MEHSIRTPSLAATTATWIAIGVLAIVILAGGVGLFPLSALIAEENPEFQSLRAPLLALALAVGLLLETILVATSMLVHFIRQDRIFEPVAARMVDVLVICVAAATVVTASTLVFIPGPPLLAFAIMASVLVGIALFFVLLVLRALLKRTVLMRTELDEVV
ncbi:MAG: DUF2975 domain-containing protein [Rhodoglobus sp.]